MRLALAEAEAATARGDVPVGAVLVDGEGRVLAAAGNRVKADHDPTAHAEMVVLRAGAARLDGARLDCGVEMNNLETRSNLPGVSCASAPAQNE